MTDGFHPYDAHCLTLFPELLEQFGEDELRSASATGTYVFHEDYFVAFVTRRSSDEVVLRRVAAYIEHLVENEDRALRDLAEIGILENLVSRKDARIAPFLGPAGSAVVARVLQHFDVDPKPWLKARKR